MKQKKMRLVNLFTNGKCLGVYQVTTRIRFPQLMSIYGIEMSFGFPEVRNN